MQRWRERMLDSVAAMYEDRYALWGFAPRGRLLRRSVPARRAQARPARFTRVSGALSLDPAPLGARAPHACACASCYIKGSRAFCPDPGPWLLHELPRCTLAA